jgi:hypothetical protein
MTENQKLRDALREIHMCIMPVPDKSVTALELAKAVSERATKAAVLLEQALESFTNATKLREALRALVEWAEGFNHQTGYCCCGDRMDTHANPMDSGHIALDEGVRVSTQLIEHARQALALPTTEPTTQAQEPAKSAAVVGELPSSDLDLEYIADCLDYYVKAIEASGDYDAWHHLPFVKSQARACRASVATQPQAQDHIPDTGKMINGLTEAETDQSASVAGLKTQAQELPDDGLLRQFLDEAKKAGITHLPGAVALAQALPDERAASLTDDDETDFDMAINALDRIVSGVTQTSSDRMFDRSVRPRKMTIKDAQEVAGPAANILRKLRQRLTERAALAAKPVVNEWEVAVYAKAEELDAGFDSSAPDASVEMLCSAAAKPVQITAEQIDAVCEAYESWQSFLEKGDGDDFDKTANELQATFERLKAALVTGAAKPVRFGAQRVESSPDEGWWITKNGVMVMHIGDRFTEEQACQIAEALNDVSR